MGEGMVRCAMTETRNVYEPMPSRPEDLHDLADRLEDIRAVNTTHHIDLIARAADRRVRLIGLGELFAAPYFALEKNPMWFDLAEDALDGPTVTALRAAARRHAMVIVAPIYEMDSSSGRRFNTAVVIEKTGEILGRFRKVHIPHGRNETGEFIESFYYDRSDGELHNGPTASGHPFYPVFATSAGRVGIAICYDRHFEETWRALARGRPDIVFSPAITFGAKSRRLWDHEFPVAAAHHRYFVGGSNRRGAEPPWNIDYFGASYFVGPDDTVENISDDPRLVIADLDFSSLDTPDPSGWDLPRDARPELD